MVNNRATAASSSHKELKHIFERRRAIMDAAIIRILKSEREKNLNDLSDMVREGGRREYSIYL